MFIFELKSKLENYTLSHNTSQNFVLLLIGLSLFTEKSSIQLILFTFLIQFTYISSCGTTSKTYEATQQECRSEQQFICKYLNWEDINCVQKVKRLENIFFKGSSLQQYTSKVLINSWMQILKHHKNRQIKYQLGNKMQVYFVASSILDLYLATNKPINAFRYKTKAGTWDSILNATELNSRWHFNSHKTW